MWLAHDTGPVCGGCRMLLFISCSVSVEPLGMDSSFDGANPCIVHTVQYSGHLCLFCWCSLLQVVYHISVYCVYR